MSICGQTECWIHMCTSAGLGNRRHIVRKEFSLASWTRFDLSLSKSTSLNVLSESSFKHLNPKNYPRSFRKSLKASFRVCKAELNSSALTTSELKPSEDEKVIVLGIDFGGTGIKGAPVDILTGNLVKERIRIPTPVPATPAAVAQVVKELAEKFEWSGVIGVGMPSVVRQGKVRSAANIDKSWININAQKLFEEVTGCQVAVLNDADAAGYAELAFGAGRDFCQSGVVLMTTFGTGIGTALFVDGYLVPNLEMGHIEVDGEIAEKRASDRVREKEELSWKKWASRVSAVLAKYEHYLQPDLMILGGGVSKKDDKFMHLLSLPEETPVVAASMRNEAGIVGAAIGGAKMLKIKDILHEVKHGSGSLEDPIADIIIPTRNPLSTDLSGTDSDSSDGGSDGHSLTDEEGTGLKKSLVWNAGESHPWAL